MRSYLGLHSRCFPGTLSEVMSMVTHRRRKIVPEMEKKRLMRTKRWRWKSTTQPQMAKRVIPASSHISNAHGMCGRLSAKTKEF